MRIAPAIPAAAALLLSLAACKPADPFANVSPAAKAEATAIFSTRCTPCHGAGGAGDGTASAGLNPKPRNFTDATWQAGVPDEHLEKIIQFGGSAVGKSPAMPSNPDLIAKPEIVSALRAYVRSLKKG